MGNLTDEKRESLNSWKRISSSLYSGKRGFKHAESTIVMHLSWGDSLTDSVHYVLYMMTAKEFLKTLGKRIKQGINKPNSILTEENIENFIQTAEDKPEGLVEAIADAIGVCYEERLEYLKSPVDTEGRYRDDFDEVLQDKDERDLDNKADEAFVRRVYDNYPSIDQYEEWGVYPIDKTVFEGLKILELKTKQDLNYRLYHLENRTSSKKYKEIITVLRWIGRLRDNMVEHYEEIDMPDKDDEFRPARLMENGKIAARYPYFSDMRSSWPYAPQYKTKHIFKT